MKKVLCILTAVLLVMTAVCAPISAADSVDVEIEVSLYDVSITVTADVEGTVTAQLTSEDKSVFYGMYSDSAPIADDGEYIYNFQFRLPDETDTAAAETGIYRVRIGNIVSADKTFNFVTPDDRRTFYNELNDKTADEMYQFLTADRKAYVTVDLTDYSALTGNILKLVNGEIADFGTTYTDIAENDTDAVAAAEEGFKQIFAEVMGIAEMATVTETEWAEFADDMLDGGVFDGKYFTDTENAESLMDIGDAYSYYKTEIEAIDVLDSAEYAKAFDKATLCLIEKTSGHDAFETAFLYFENKGVITPDMTNISALVNAGVDTDLWKNVMALENADCKAIVDNVVAEAKELIDIGILNGGGSGSGSGGGGGTGGGAGGSSAIDKPIIPNSSGTVGGGNTPEIKPAEPVLYGSFSDVLKTHWAYSAIEELADKGILNGKGDGKYAPDDGVTREEFVKIIAVAFDLTADGEYTFADVSADRWSAEFIKAAATNGIVTGDGEKFNPTAVITRQDMAVIIHRIFEHFGAEVSGEAISFDDGAEIADYAKDAVAALTGAGIINGMGDGTFAPKATVTRAQSAKVVYELLNLLGGGK